MPQTAAWQKDALLLGTMDAGISCLPFNTRETLAWITSDVDARLVRALPDGKHLATLGIGAVSVVLIETKTGEIEAELKPGHGTISSLDTSTDGKLLASLSQQADEATDQVTTKIAIWDIATQKLMHEILTDHNISSIRFGADNNSLVGLGAAEILVWDISGAGVPAPRVVSVDDTALPVDYAPKKHLAALASVDKVVIVDVDTGARLRTLSPLSDKIRLLSFSPDGGLLVVGTESGKLVVYDTADGTMKYDFSEQQSALPDFLTFSPDGKTLGAGGYRDWRFWNLKDGKLLGALVLYQPDEWVALDAENNFDASPGAMSRLFWQVGNRQVDLADYKKKYYTPGLLKKWLQQK